MSKISAQKLLHRQLSQHIRSPDLRLNEDRSAWIVSGGLKVGGKFPQIEIHYYRNIQMLRYYPPKVWCHEPWIRRDIDWHVYTDGELCWVLDNEWRDIQRGHGKSNVEVVIDGCTWIIQSTHLLLTRHLYGSLISLNIWPSDWKQWGHGLEGVREYQSMKSRGKNHDQSL